MQNAKSKGKTKQNQSIIRITSNNQTRQQRQKKQKQKEPREALQLSTGLLCRNSSGAFRSLAAQVLSHRRVIFAQKSTKTMIKIQHLFLTVFVRFWSSSWSLLGGQNRPKMAQVGLKTALETLFFEKRGFSRNRLKQTVSDDFWLPRWPPK